MKILHIIADGDPGGGSTFVLEMISSLHHAVLLSQKKSWVIQEAQRLGVETHELNFLTSRLDVRIAWYMHKLIRHISPDMVHVHGSRAAFFLSLLKLKTPILYTVHGLHGVYNGNLFGMWGDRQSMRCADHIVFVSRWEQTLAKRKKMLPHLRYQTIYNGIALRDLPTPNPNRKLLGFLGRLEEPKDPLFMIEVMHILGPLGFHLKMIGGGTFEKRLRDSPYISVTGKLPHKRALEELAQVSTIIIPSKWEAFGLVMLEAMALGIPIIAARIPPFEEILISGETGVLVDQKNPKKYSLAILKGEDYSQAAQKHVREVFSWDRCFKQYRSVFNKLHQNEQRDMPE